MKIHNWIQSHFLLKKHCLLWLCVGHPQLQACKAVLYCIVLYCIVLYCIVLYCIVLYCIVLYCIVLYCIVLYCIVLYCIVLYCIVLYCIDLLYMIFHKCNHICWPTQTAGFRAFLVTLQHGKRKLIIFGRK